MSDAARLLPNDPAMLRAAFGDLGLREIAGRLANPRIVQMYATAGHPEVKSDEVAWCAAAWNTWAIESGYAGTKSLAARSGLTWGQPVNINGKIPRGATLIFKRGDSSWQGHICLCLADEGATLLVIGGNQSNKVCVQRFRKSSLIGARVPLTVTNSNVVRLFGGSTVSEGAAHVSGQVSDYLNAGADPVSGALTQAQDVAMQAAGYLKWAQYALVVIGILLAVWAIWRYAKAWIWPQPVPEIPAEAEPAYDLLDAPAPVKRRRKKPKARRKKKARR